MIRSEDYFILENFVLQILFLQWSFRAVSDYEFVDWDKHFGDLDEALIEDNLRLLRIYSLTFGEEFVQFQIREFFGQSFINFRFDLLHLLLMALLFGLVLVDFVLKRLQSQNFVLWVGPAHKRSQEEKYSQVGYNFFHCEKLEFLFHFINLTDFN